MRSTYPETIKPSYQTATKKSNHSAVTKQRVVTRRQTTKQQQYYQRIQQKAYRITGTDIKTDWFKIVHIDMTQPFNNK